MNKEKNFRTLNVAVIIFFVLIFASAVLFQIRTNHNTAIATSKAMIVQLEDVITTNENNIESLMNTLKEEYIVRAKAVEYIIVNGARTKYTPEEYGEIAELLNIDEIHIFDTSGEIVDGTNPEYYGYNFDSGTQMGYFKPMLKDHSLSMCQDVTPNTAEGRQMMYAITWMSNGKGMIQVGITPEHLIAEMRNQNISDVIKGMPVVNGMDIYVFDRVDHSLEASTDKDIDDDAIAKFVSEIDRLDQKQKGSSTVDAVGHNDYMTIDNFNKYCIVVTVDAAAANKNVVINSLLLVMGLVAAFIMITIVIRKSVRDLTKSRGELQTALESAQKANVAKTVFLNNMSHDIRTPLNAITGFTDIAINNIDSKDKVLDCLEKTKKSGKILLELINDILEMSRIESENSQLNESSVEMRDVFDEISPPLYELADKKEIDLTFDISSLKDSRVYADRTRLDRVLINVINNAVKYTNNGGCVRVQLSQVENERDGFGSYCFVIEDNGIGMSEEFQKHLFERFSRENCSDTAGAGGTGLGLAVTKAFVDLMGGRIDVQSRQNEGSRFTITIPFRLQEVNESSEGITKKINEADDILKGKRILLVEDNELNREIAGEILTVEGAEIEEAFDGTEALNKIESKNIEYYDLILMDIRMPGMNGYETTREIRRRYPECRVPIVALSANAFEEDRKLSHECGMDGHISKPIIIDQLKAEISKVLRR